MTRHGSLLKNCDGLCMLEGYISIEGTKEVY